VRFAPLELAGVDDVARHDLTYREDGREHVFLADPDTTRRAAARRQCPR